MIGAPLSRWTLSYVAAALAALLGGEILMAAGYGYPAAPLQSAPTFVLVHVIALGWLSLLMCGALFQLVPVLVARPLHDPWLPLPALVLLIGGIAALLCGFARLGGAGAAPCFAAATALLGAGFSLVIWTLGRTLWAARPLALPARFVAVGLCGLGAAVLLGATFAVVLGGSLARAFFVDLAASGLPIHVIAGLGGWLTFTAMGVSYRLLSMFMLAPEIDGWTARSSLFGGAAALGLAIVGGTLAIAVGRTAAAPLLAAGAVGLIAAALYGRDMVQLYRTRRRRDVELNSRMAGLALASLALAAGLIAAALITGSEAQRAAAVFLAAFGWLSGLGLSQLYKIVPFLTWLECYGPVLGREITPRVQDLVAERRASAWFLLYYAAVWSGTLALIAGQAEAFSAAAAVMAVATAAIVAELVRARRLADVDAAERLPPGARRPPLLFAAAPMT